MTLISLNQEQEYQLFHLVLDVNISYWYGKKVFLNKHNLDEWLLKMTNALKDSEEIHQARTLIRVCFEKTQTYNAGIDKKITLLEKKDWRKYHSRGYNELKTLSKSDLIVISVDTVFNFYKENPKVTAREIFETLTKNGKQI
jgi:hypothetical protein